MPRAMFFIFIKPSGHLFMNDLPRFSGRFTVLQSWEDGAYFGFIFVCIDLTVDIHYVVPKQYFRDDIEYFTIFDLHVIVHFSPLLRGENQPLFLVFKKETKKLRIESILLKKIPILKNEDGHHHIVSSAHVLL